MRSAKFRARLGRIVLSVVMAFSTTAVLTAAPEPARATVSQNYCLSSFFDELQQFLELGNTTECAPGTAAIPELAQRVLLFSVWAMYHQYMSGFHAGGKPEAYRRQMELENGRSKAEHLARTWVDPELGRGLAAGAAPTRTFGEAIDGWMQPFRDLDINAWFNTSWSSPRDDFRLTRYDSDVWTLTFGADMPIINEDLIFGMFGSYTNSDVDTSFNNGDVETKLGTIGPYVAYTMNEYLGFDATVAGVFGEHDNVVGSPVPGAPNLRGDQETAGFFISLNANANYWIGNWGVQGRLGFLHSDMETDSYNLGGAGLGGAAPIRVAGQNNELTQVQTAVQLNYFYDRGLPKLESVMAMPYFRVTYNHDLDHENIQLPVGPQAENDDDEVVLNWGVTLFGNGPFSGSVEAGYTAGRADFESWQMSGTVSYAF